MTDDTAAQNWIEIPGETGVIRTVVPNIRIELPLVAHSHKLKSLAMAIPLLFISIIFCFGTLAFTIVLLDFQKQLKELIEIIIAIVLFGFCAIAFSGLLLTETRDIFRLKPSLIIRETGFTDLRCKVSMNWSDIASGTLSVNRNAVQLRLRRPVRTFQNPFRVGVFGVVFRQRPDRFQLSVGFLDKSQHLLAYTIPTLIKRNGGEGIIKEGAFDLPLDITGPARL